MLKLHFKEEEYYNERENRFVTAEAADVLLEHSLVSVYTWESKWKVEFLSDKEKTREQTIDYVRCMEVGEPSDPDLFDRLTNDQLRQVSDYINDKMSATVITKRTPPRRSSEKVTAEVIYFWMIQAGIPFTCETWHLSKLLMLIEVCAAKSGPQQKMGRKEQMAQQRALNAARCSKFKTRG